MPGEEDGVDRQRGVGRPSSQEPDDDERSGHREAVREMLGEREHQADGERTGQVDQERHPGKVARRERVVRFEEIPGHRAERPTDKDGRHRRGGKSHEWDEGRLEKIVLTLCGERPLT